MLNTGGGKKQLRRCMKHNRMIYFSYYKLLNRDYRKQKSAMASSLKSIEQIRMEMNKCKNYWHCPPVQYIRYGLFGKQLSIDEILDYIPAFRFYNGYMEKQLKGVNESLYGNKLNLYYLFRKYNIPTPRVIALVKRGMLFTPDEEPLPYERFVSSLNKDKKYFFKPVDGAGGTGIEVLKSECFDICEAFVTRLNKASIYIVQEGIMQRDDFLQINSSSVNTLRIITQYNNAFPRICACVMRIGRNGKDVDNSAQGGLSCFVNLDNGTLNETATAEHGGGTYYEHPDSGFVFKGKRIESWTEIKNAVLAYARNFPELKELGWDIAVTLEGVQVIEMNLGYGIDHLQVSCGGMRRALNVYPM